MLFSNLYIIKKSFIKRLLGQFWDRAVQYFVEKLCDLWKGTPNKFADLRLRNWSKNLRICDLRTFEKSLLAHLCSLLVSSTYTSVRGIFWFLFFYVRYSKLLHLPPLRFQGVGGCWGRTQDCCYCALALTARCSNHSERSHPPGLSSFQFPRIFCCLNPWGYFAERIVSKVL
jgi:hypothetical protein